MSVTSTGDFTGPYTPDGVTTVFPFDFAALSADEVAVLRLSSAGVETLLTGYTVVTSTSGGTITFPVAPIAGDPIYIVSNPSFEQQATFANQGAFSPSALTAALDRAAIRDSILRAAMARAALAPPTESLGVLPTAAVRAGKYLFFDINGNATVASGTSGSGTVTDGVYGDITVSSGGTVFTIGGASVSLTKMASLAANSILGNNTGSPATPAALTATQVTAMLNPATGDSGSGGVKGLVPAPAAGDAAAGKFLKSDGTWAVPATSVGSVAWGAITGTLSSQTDLNTALAAKAPLASPTFTGTPAAPTAAPGTNTTQLATTAFVVASYATTAALATYAPLASPPLTGTPTAPTAGAGTATTQLATTAFVDAMRDITSNPQTGAYALVLTDRGKVVPNTTGGWAIPANASVAFPIGTVVFLYNNSGSAQSITIASDNLFLDGANVSGTRTLAAWSMGYIHKPASTTTWVAGGKGMS